MTTLSDIIRDLANNVQLAVIENDGKAIDQNDIDEMVNDVIEEIKERIIA